MAARFLGVFLLRLLECKVSEGGNSDWPLRAKPSRSLSWVGDGEGLGQGERLKEVCNILERAKNISILPATHFYPHVYQPTIYKAKKI